jgi:hypothetical protein
MSLVKFSQKYSLRKIIQSTVLALSSTFILSTASADIIFVEDFETNFNKTIGGNHPQLGNSGNAPQIVAAENGVTPRDGSHMMKTYLHRFNSNTTYRTETVLKGNSQFKNLFEKGKDYWLGVSVFLPADWSMDYSGTKNGKAVEERLAGGIILQYHDRSYKDSSWRSGLPLVISHAKEGFRIWNRADGCRNRPECVNNSNVKNSITRFQKKSIPMLRGQWNDFVMHIKWSPNSDGLIQIWVNGKLELDSKGSNYYNEYPANTYPYFKMGLYQSQYGKSDWSKEINWGVIERTLYHDELRIGNANSSYDEIVPKGGKTPILDTQAPSIPSNLKASKITQTTMALNWNASTDNVAVKEYEVEYNGVTKIVTGTTITLNGLTPNVNYSTKVRAKDAAGNISAFSVPETAVTDAKTTPTDPSIPTDPPSDDDDEEKSDASQAGSFNQTGILSLLVLLALIRRRTTQRMRVLINN